MVKQPSRIRDIGTMFWVVQHHLWREEGFELLMNALDRLACPHAVVRVVPFTNRLIPVDYNRDAELDDIPEPELPAHGHIMACGSVTLARIAKTRGWVPGSFLNDNFDVAIWQQHYGDRLLNVDSQICRFDEVAIGSEPVFIRPCKDTKAFTGKVFDKAGFDAWRADVLQLTTGFTTLRADTLVAVAPAKPIHREYRFFVVDGVVVTGSQYRLGTQIVTDSRVDDDVLRFARETVKVWQPARAFVLDVALTPDGLRVVEINNVNSAGFYACDVMQLVAAIERMSFSGS